MIAERNFAPGNAGYIFWYDILAPAFLVVMYDIPLALFALNAGVEVGQLVFIGGVLGVLAYARQITTTLKAVKRPALFAATYAIGALAAF